MSNKEGGQKGQGHSTRLPYGLRLLSQCLDMIRDALVVAVHEVVVHGLGKATGLGGAAHRMALW